MPPVVIAVVMYAAGAITIGALVMVVLASAVGAWQATNARKAAREAYNANLRDRLVSVATTTGYRSRVYGTVRNVDGVLFKGTHGPDSRFYTFVVAVAGHEIDGFESAYFNDVCLEVDATGWVRTPPWAKNRPLSQTFPITVVNGVGTATLTFFPLPGTVVAVMPGASRWEPSVLMTATMNGRVCTVTSSRDGAGVINYQTRLSDSFARVRFYTGTPTQDLSGELVALGLPDIHLGRHRFAGIACMLITLTYDTDCFAGGLPQFTAVFRGARCLDRRTGLTAYTSNPAVISDDWACYPYGGGLAPAELSEDLLIASGNAADVPHTFSAATQSAASTVVQTMPVYQCGIVCKTDADPSETLSAIVETMAGQWGWAGGMLRIKGGYYSGPVLTVDESWYSGHGSRGFNSGLPEADIFNIYNATIADRAQNYLVVPVAPVRANAYIYGDGGELPISGVFTGIPDAMHAQHVAGVLMRKARQGFTFSLPANFKALRLELFDTVAVNLERFGLGNKVMEVATWSFTQESGISMVLREVSPEIFEPDAGFFLLDTSPNTSLPKPWDVAALTGLHVTSGTAELTDKSVVTRTRVTWDRAADESVRVAGVIEVAYLEMRQFDTYAGTGGSILLDQRAVYLDGAELVLGAADQSVSEDGAAWTIVEASGDSIEVIILGLKSDAVYIFKIRARNALGVRGEWCINVPIFITSDLMGGGEGPQGPAGIPGAAGADGLTSYFHIAYSASADGSVAFNQTGGAYVGTYVDFMAADSPNYLAYTWRLFQGADGADGTNGIPGTNGGTGAISYLHIKYSDDGGATFTTNAGETSGSWIGTFVDQTLADPATTAPYSWARLLAPTYRQEGVPVGAAQGSTWQVPSTGRQYIYIGTTWYPTVGTGSIDTGELANYAATMVASDAWSPKQYTRGVNQPRHLFLWATLDNPTAMSLEVQLTVSMTFDFFQGIANGNTVQMLAGFTTPGTGTTNAWPVFDLQEVTPDMPRYLPVTRMVNFIIDPHTSVQYCAGFYCNFWGIDALAPNNTEMRVMDAQLRAELIKR